MDKILPILEAIVPVILRLSYALDPERTKEFAREMIDMLDEFDGEDAPS